MVVDADDDKTEVFLFLLTNTATNNNNSNDNTSYVQHGGLFLLRLIILRRSISVLDLLTLNEWWLECTSLILLFVLREEKWKEEGNGSQDLFKSHSKRTFFS